jgi:hypothetical protein
MINEQTDNVNHPAHYGGADNLYEHIKVMEATLTRDEFVGAMRFNITKYLQRERGKGGTEDVLKAQWYMNRLATYLMNIKGQNIMNNLAEDKVTWGRIGRMKREWARQDAEFAARMEKRKSE